MASASSGADQCVGRALRHRPQPESVPASAAPPQDAPTTSSPGPRSARTGKHAVVNIQGLGRNGVRDLGAAGEPPHVGIEPTTFSLRGRTTPSHPLSTSVSSDTAAPSERQFPDAYPSFRATSHAMHLCHSRSGLTPCRPLRGRVQPTAANSFPIASSRRAVGYLLAMACSHQVVTGAGRQANFTERRADVIAASLPEQEWQRLSPGQGSKGPRLYGWAWATINTTADARIAEPAENRPGQRWLLIRRNSRTGELAYYRCYAPGPLPPRELVRVAGRRWTVEESFQAGRGHRADPRLPRSGSAW